MEFSANQLAILNNVDGFYEGNNLRYYADALLELEASTSNGYHNMKHSLFMMEMAYDALVYYWEMYAPRERYEIIFSFLAHDANNLGIKCDEHNPDDINIARAIAWVSSVLLEEDKDLLPGTTRRLWYSRYPYVVPEEEIDLSGQFMRDADMCQVLSKDWFSVITGLAKEWKISVQEMLQLQDPFLKNLTFRTEWAKIRFPSRLIAERRHQCNYMANLLTAA